MGMRTPKLVQGFWGFVVSNFFTKNPQNQFGEGNRMTVGDALS